MIWYEMVSKPTNSLVKSIDYLDKVGLDLEDLLPTGVPHVIASPKPVLFGRKVCIKPR